MNPYIKQAVDLAIKEDKAMLKHTSVWHLIGMTIEMIVSAVLVTAFAAMAIFVVVMSIGIIRYAWEMHGAQ